ncbi:hypothetical protein MLD38_006607 [Melastoma candidum]|uniref:Uncharacterized protein n=1 Tax=Melastoma candidum TaxID=119954 RepID=A0ACB9RN54_9MYRT|nr:hypothetical protein MLD38_006607 [Melastoma candidum]
MQGVEKDSLCDPLLLPHDHTNVGAQADGGKKKKKTTWFDNRGEGFPEIDEVGAGSRRSTSRLNKYALWGSVLASTNSVLLGYDIGVMSGAILYIREDMKINSAQVEVLVGSLNVVSLLGSLAAGRISDTIGRRLTILLAATTFLAGAVLMGLAPSFPFLVAGRLVAGVGVGFALMIAPVYAAEISPATTRGLMSSLPEVFINVGILLGYVSNYVLSGLPSDINWRLMLGLAALPAIVIGFGIMAMPESPRWMVMEGRLEEARRVLIKVSESKEEADFRLSEMVNFTSFGPDMHPGPCQWTGQGVWKELLWSPSRSIRRILVAAIGVNFFMQASGNDAVIYYSPEVFREAGISNHKHLVGVTVIMGLVKTSFVLISAMYLDRFGRRPLLLIGSIGMAVSLFGLGLGSKFLELSGSEKPGWVIALCVVAVCMDVSFFSIGLGPVTWVYSSEIFPTRLRAQGNSLAISVNRLVSGAVAMSFLSVSKEISFGGMFLVLSGIMALAAAFFYFRLPETKGKSLEEIEALFEDKQYSTRRMVKEKETVRS